MATFIHQFLLEEKNFAFEIHIILYLITRSNQEEEDLHPIEPYMVCDTNVQWLFSSFLYNLFQVAKFEGVWVLFFLVPLIFADNYD